MLGRSLPADMEFKFWMKEVDAWIDKMTGDCGVTSDELADYLYRDAFDAGVTPRTAAKWAIKADKGE